jgi:DNA-cytosine methyltransferase
MNVLSLFDGMSCGQIALDRLGVRVDQYFAAEIDKYAMQVAKKNYPNTQHIGNVLDVKGEDLPKIDLLIGGSPCQGFSFAGKQLNFDDPRSKLFFEFVRLLDETKPTYFLLENVRMKKEYQDVISEHLGVEPIMINSALMSAQNRVRLYWTNIPGLEQPEDKGVLLKDVLEGDVEKNNDYFLRIKEATKKGYTDINVGDCFDATFPTSKTRRGRNMKNKCNCLTAANYEYMVFENPSATKTGKSYTLTAAYSGAVAWNSIERKQRTMIPFERSNEDHPNVVNGYKYRKLTPIECERLQTVPDDYSDCVSNTQRYKMLGNGWTVDVIAHIFKGIENQELVEDVA